MDDKNKFEERKQWIDYLNNIKNSQINRMNASALKSSTLVVFLISTLIFFVNKIPTSIPDANKISIIFVLLTYLINISLFVFNFQNFIFRRQAVSENLGKKFNELEKQYMLPSILVSIIAGTIGICLNIFSFRETVLNPVFNEINPISFAVFAFMEVIMLKGSLTSLLKNYLRINDNDEKSIVRTEKVYWLKKCVLRISLFAKNLITFGQLIIIYDFINLSKIELIYVNRDILIYSIYIAGLIFSFSLLAKYYSYKIIISWIEQLLDEIMKNDLPINQIKEKFYKDYSININLETFYFEKDKKWLAVEWQDALNKKVKK